ncbi:MAG: DNA mismatch repair protein MutS, partial [Alphaproteobacteria bacterium]|nr:DNA mismatch repair protein MutS [Alphaproteobacteria bacterium]
MQIDAATRRNLELTQSLSGGKDGSLLAAIDRTLTAGGGRLLARRISAPSRVLDVIHARLDAVDYLAKNASLRDTLRGALRQTPDMDRALSRLGLDRSGPRDLAAIRDGLSQSGALSAAVPADAPALIAGSAEDLTGHDALADVLRRAVVDEPPLRLSDGGFVAPGFLEQLDEARKLRDEGRGVIAGMQADYAGQTGISSLKIKHNNVLGYFIETTATHAEKMLAKPLSETFIHRQTTANAVRFTTVPLSELETKILNAGNRALELERRIFEELRAEILGFSGPINLASAALAKLDVAAALAKLATEEAWVRPVVDDSRAFEITGGRHPVVERALHAQGGAPFIANDADLTAEDGAAIWLLTGPNMAGKSTFLRQNALIAMLAQSGSFVPADAAHIGVVSQLFSRVGASDDLARGRSTFMVEMVETAAILNQADDRALVILDEIGRGTATYDGLSIAWATLEHLHDGNKCRALFATHYHELTVLNEKLAGVENATISVKEWDGEVIFLHEVRKGAADRSYGVQVARLAGLPAAVIERAKVVLDALEKGEREGGVSKGALIDDLPLFSLAPAAPTPAAKSTKLEDALNGVHPDELTPKDALALIYRLKELSTS